MQQYNISSFFSFFFFFYYFYFNTLCDKRRFFNQMSYLQELVATNKVSGGLVAALSDMLFSPG